MLTKFGRAKIIAPVDLISILRFGRLWYGEPNAVSNAVDYAKFRNRSHDAVIRVYDEARNVVETHEHKRRVQRVVTGRSKKPPHGEA